MANNITVENLNISGTLSANIIRTKQILSDGEDAKDITAALEALSKLPKNPVKTVNGIPAGEDGNIQIPQPIDQSYTAFEVFPTTETISAGTHHPHLGYITNEISPCNTQRIGFRTTVHLQIEDYQALSGFYSTVSVDFPTASETTIDDHWTLFTKVITNYRTLATSGNLSAYNAFETAVLSVVAARLSADCNIEIDWGDGNKGHIGQFLDMSLSSVLSSYNLRDTYYYKLYKATEIGVIVSHTYDLAYCNKPSRVKITGNTFFAFSTYSVNLLAEGSTCISKHLTKDYPIASHLTQIGYIMMASPFVTSIDIPENMIFGADESEGTKLYNLARNCKNLLTVKGLKNKIKKSDSLGYAFYNCGSLIECDLTFPEIITSWGSEDGLYAVFSGCKSLRGTVDKFLPSTSITTLNDVDINCKSMFSNCSTLTINDINFIGSILWDSPTSNKFKNTSTAFSTCSNVAVRRYVPTEWGGIEPTELTTEERIAVLEEKVAALEAQL